ncbi:MAG: MATE family efflux transporter [Treponema sp.]|jgi:putative MATE family efflux protein|nr:MATE family efflux transporter [Treponema sp.]
MGREKKDGKGIALDLVEPWTAEETEAGAVRKVKDVISLPSGVTSGMLYRDVVRIALPSVSEMILTQLASMVDLMMVGRLGPWAISSVGISTQPKFIVMMLFMAMNVGATAMVARYKGAGKPERANAILRQALVLTTFFALIGSAGGYVFSEHLVRFMGAPDAETVRGGTAYLRIQCLGLLGFALTSTATATLRGVGNTRTSMIYNMVANIVNVIFNYLLIYGNFGFPRLEVMGASIATIIGQFTAFFLAMSALLRGKNYIRLRLKDSFKPNREALGAIFRIGLPALVEQAIMRIGVVSYTRIVTSLGTLLYATHMACMNIQQMSFMLGQALAVSATSLVGQSLGKRRPDMAQFYATRTRRVGLAVSLVLAFTFAVFGRQIIALYAGDNNESREIIELGSQILRLVALILPFQSSQFILAGALRGAGDTRSIAAIIFVTVLLVRPGIAGLTVTVFHWGLWGAWIALFLDQVLRSFFVLLRYNSGKWKTAIKG